MATTTVRQTKQELALRMQIAAERLERVTDRLEAILTAPGYPKKDSDERRPEPHS